MARQIILTQENGLILQTIEDEEEEDE